MLKMLTVGGRMWILLVVFVSMNHGFYASFTPTDSYLLACGSSQNVTFFGQTYVPPFFPVYQSARIFPSNSS